MRSERSTVTRSHKLDLCLLAVFLVVLIWSAQRRLRVYFRAEPPAASRPG